jgi:hypothetical protein
VPTVWPAAVSIPPHATAKRHGSAPQTFLNTVLWPEFQEINAALHDYLAQVTDKVIREAVYKHTGDAEEVAEPEKLGR